MPRSYMTAAKVVAQILLNEGVDWNGMSPEQVLDYLRSSKWPDMDLPTVKRALQHLQEGVQ